MSSDTDPTEPYDAHALRDALVQRYDIDSVSATTLVAYGFQPDTFDRLRTRLTGRPPPTNNTPADNPPTNNNAAPAARLDVNRVCSTSIEPPRDDDLVELPAIGTPEYSQLAAQGLSAIAAGEVAVLLLAGGMATRFGGGVKALAEVVDGLRFIDAKLADLEVLAGRIAGRADGTNAGTSDKADKAIVRTVPLWLMTSFRTDAALREWADEMPASVPISFAPQSISMRLDLYGELFRTDDGAISLYAPGHGDVGQALQSSGLLADFITRGGRHIFVSNVDNVAATLDPAVIGAHRQTGRSITCEVTRGNEVGGAPWVVNGSVQIIEAFRLPADLNPAATGLVNTNSLVVDADVFNANQPLTWFEVHKQVGNEATNDETNNHKGETNNNKTNNDEATGNKTNNTNSETNNDEATGNKTNNTNSETNNDGTTSEVVQFERLIGDLTASVQATMLVVERCGIGGRFQPVKDPAELCRRQPQIREILTARGILANTTPPRR